MPPAFSRVREHPWRPSRPRPSCAMSVSRVQSLGQYRKLLRAAEKFSNYNFRDYALRIVTKNLQTFESFLKDKLANVEQVENIESTIILNQTIVRHSPQLSQN